MYPRQVSWDQAQAAIDQASGPLASLCDESAREAAADGFVFDSWLQQEDHDDHPHNVIVGWNPGNPADRGLAFLDFAFAMGIAGWREVGPARYPALLKSRLTPQSTEAALSKVENLSADRVVEVVQRVPGDFMPEDVRQGVAEQLVTRKVELRDALSEFCQGFYDESDIPRSGTRIQLRPHRP